MSTLDILLIVAITITAIVTWLIQRSVNAKRFGALNERLQQQLQVTEQLQEVNKTLQTEKENLIQQVTTLQSQLQFLNDQYHLFKRYQKENEILTGQLSMFKAKFQAAEEKFENQKKDAAQIGEHLKLEFKNLAQNIFEEKMEKFTQLNEEKINAILAPLKTQFTDFKHRIEGLYDKEAKNTLPFVKKYND